MLKEGGGGGGRRGGKGREGRGEEHGKEDMIIIKNSVIYNFSHHQTFNKLITKYNIFF